MNFLQGMMPGMGMGMGGMQQNQALVEVKAGRMNFDGKRVTADLRRGKLQVVRDLSGMKKFEWTEASANQPTESFYVFPGDAKFEKVKQSKDRVFLLEFTSQQRRHFYWFQDRDEKEKDEEFALKIHNHLNDLPEGTPRQQTRSIPPLPPPPIPASSAPAPAPFQ